MESENTASSGEVAAGEEGASGQDRKEKSPWWWFAALAGIFVLNLCAFVMWSNPAPTRAVDELDASWAKVLDWAYLNHIDFGHDLVFTHGPWGFVAAGSSPETAATVMAAWIFLSIAYFAALVTISRQMTTTRWVAAVWLIAVVLLTGPPVNMVDARLLLLSWFLLLIHFYVDARDWSPVKILLTVAIALSSLIKFSLFATAAPVLAVVTADQIWRRRAPTYLIVYVVSLMGFWLAAHQPLGSIGPYLLHSWKMADGYVEGVSLFSPTELVDIGQFILVALLFLGSLAVVHPWRKGAGLQRAGSVLDEVAARARPRETELIDPRKSALAIIGTAGLIFLIFKGGYVRHDVHEIAATAAMAIMAVTFTGTVWPRIRGGGAQIFLVLVSFAGVYLSWESQLRLTMAGGPENLFAEIEQIPNRLGSVVDAFVGTSAQPQNSTADDLGYSPPPLPKVDGPVDIYPWGQRQLLAQGMDYRPRPVFHSYLAFTDFLSNLNARFLTSNRAAPTILFDLKTIDHHYPSLDDAASWPEILTRYDLTDASGSYLVLRRSSEPREFSLTPISTRQGRLGHWISVPQSDDPIWVNISVHLTPLGQLTRLLYKPPPLLLGVTTAGQPKRFRLIRELDQTGFLLSPEISDRMAFGLLYSKDWKNQLAVGHVTDMGVAVAFSESGGSVCYDDDYTIQFSALHYPHTDISQVPGMADYLNLRQFFLGAHFLQIEPTNPPDFVENDFGKMVIKAPPHTQMLIPAPPNARGFSAGFGMFTGSYATAEHATYKIYAIDTEIGKQISAGLAWGVELDPVNVITDRGTHHITLLFPPGKKIYGLILETDTDDQNKGIDMYWTDLKFQ